MSLTPTFPGVYIQEIPTGSHTVQPASTGIAAFVGRAPCGPVDEARTVFSFGDFTRLYGGLALDFPVTYAVADFFRNGGSEAVIARLFQPGDHGSGYALLAFPPPGQHHASPHTETPEGFSVAKAAKAGEDCFVVNGRNAQGEIHIADDFLIQDDDTIYTVRTRNHATGAVNFLPAATRDFTGAITIYPPLALLAASPGAWGNSLRATIDTHGITDTTSAQFAAKGLFRADLFNLTLELLGTEGKPVETERYVNVSVKQAGLAARFPNRLDRVLMNSSLCRVQSLPLHPPSAVTILAARGNDGDYLTSANYLGDPYKDNTGIHLLNTVATFNLLCIPPDRRLSKEVPGPQQDLDNTVRLAASQYCTGKRAIYIVDPPSSWEQKIAAASIAEISPEDLGITGQNGAGTEIARNAAVYFPNLIARDPLRDNAFVRLAPCGAVAGVIAASDVSRGVWKAPVGADAVLAGVASLAIEFTDAQNGVLSALGINCLRSFPSIGPVIWGARTLRGADAFDDDYKYLSIRRLTLFIEESLYLATQWAVFEPNNEELWSSLRLSVGSFLAGLARQGAFYNYSVTCDATTTTLTDIANGVVNIVIAIAPVKPAEFVMIEIQQQAARAAS